MAYNHGRYFFTADRKQDMTPTPANPRTLRNDVLFAFVLLLAAYFAWLARAALLLLYVSALFAVVLMPVVRSIERLRIRGWRPGKGATILIMLLAVGVFFTGFGFLAIPPIARDLQQLSEQPFALPQLLIRIHRIPLLGRIDGEQLSQHVQAMASHAAGGVLLSIRSWAAKLMDLLTGIVLTVYFILEGDRAYRWFLSFIAPRRRERLDRTLRRASERMGRWLLGQFGLMLILGVVSTTVYALLHVRYAYALGVLTGLLNIIPVLGAAITILLVLFIAAIDSWTKVLGVAIFYAIYIQIENSLLTPRIMQNRVGLPGLGVLVALLFGFALAGVAGALVAVPTAVLVSELVEEYLVWKDLPLAGPP
ncbi:MAG: AI-2E family transporter [Acidobacteriota bacterium]